MPDTLKAIVQQLQSLPLIPSVIVKVTEQASNPRTSALDLARTILTDQALTARLLRVVNSPLYGFPRRIATVTEAVTILGFNAVRNLLLSSSVVDLLAAEETPEFSPRALWEHAVGTAVGASRIAAYLRHEAQEELFVAGLLHDVGKLVLFHCQPKDYGAALQAARADDLPLRTGEQRVFGAGHDQVGRLLAERWKLPVRLGEAVGYHHRPDLAQVAVREATMVHAADVIAHALQLGSGGEDAVPALHQACWDSLGFPVGSFPSMMTEIEDRFEDVRAALLGGLNAQARPPDHGQRSGAPRMPAGMR